MPKLTFEVLRSRRVTLDERIEIEVDVPARVAEEDRNEWVRDQFEEGNLKAEDSEWELASEDEESVDYQEATEL